MGEQPEMIEALGSEHPCVYLPSQVARLAYLYSRHPLQPSQMDQQLAQGQRRSGPYLYYVNCRTCRACQPTRIIIDEFVMSKSLRRVLSRGDKKIECRFQQASAAPDRVRLYNLHRTQRDLGMSEDEASEQEYHDFLIATCCDTREMAFYIDGVLIGCTIIDYGKRSMSAVYTFFDTAYSNLSIGTYAVLKLVEKAKLASMQYVYLGLYVSDNQHLRYKARYVVQERYINGVWHRVEQPTTNSRPLQKSNDVKINLL